MPAVSSFGVVLQPASTIDNTANEAKPQLRPTERIRFMSFIAPRERRFQ
jgi:hypothetical protein